MVTRSSPRLLVLGALSLVSVAVVAPPSAQAQSARPAGEWHATGGDHTNTKYSPLDQITAENFTDLEIAVIPLEGLNTFIELAQPTSSDTTSARFLERYGEGIYLTIYEIEDSLAMDSYLQGQGVQFTSSRVTANYTNLGFNSIWLHPRAMKGAFTQLSQVFHPENPWPPAGDTWYR